ncbi:hypothetical protein [Chitinimonas lacunae]|uniref:Uncharacterized protein n=1 Tax=Chitinimonas lacunae TaxID=1963018 RepID=A0ABV8MRT8_9NEIS
MALRAPLATVILAAAISPHAAETTDQLIIGVTPALLAEPSKHLPSLSQAVGTDMVFVRQMGERSWIVKLPSRLNEAALEALMAKLRQQPGIESVEADRMMQHMRRPMTVGG